MKNEGVVGKRRWTEEEEGTEKETNNAQITNLTIYDSNVVSNFQVNKNDHSLGRAPHSNFLYK